MVSVDDFATEIMQALMDYDDEVESTMQSEVDKTARKALKLLKTHDKIPVDTGAYKKSFKIKKLAQGRGYNRKLLYAGGEEYKKTHLLEEDHLIFTGYTKPDKRSGKPQHHTKGGRSKAFPHWVDAQKMAEELYDEIQRKLKK